MMKSVKVETKIISFQSVLFQINQPQNRLAISAVALKPNVDGQNRKRYPAEETYNHPLPSLFSYLPRVKESKNKMVGRPGFEPGTSFLSGKRSKPLS